MNAGYTYTLRLPTGGVTISTAITVLQLANGASNPSEILRIQVSQRGSTTSAQERVQIVRKTAAATVTAAVVGTTLIKNNQADPTPAAQLGTALTGHTGSAEGTDGNIYDEWGFNVLNGFVWLPTPEERLWIPAAGIIAIKFPTAPASQSWNASITYREYV